MVPLFSYLQVSSCPVNSTKSSLLGLQMTSSSLILITLCGVWFDWKHYSVRGHLGRPVSVLLVLQQPVFHHRCSHLTQTHACSGAENEIPSLLIWEKREERIAYSIQWNQMANWGRGQCDLCFSSLTYNIPFFLPPQRYLSSWIQRTLEQYSSTLSL
jgi:hypothetical protein